MFIAQLVYDFSDVMPFPGSQTEATLNGRGLHTAAEIIVGCKVKQWSAYHLFSTTTFASIKSHKFPYRSSKTATVP